MEATTAFVGLDVHKASIAVAIAEGGLGDAAVFFGTIENTQAARAKRVAKLGRKHQHLSFCYKAGPCGLRGAPPADQGWAQLLGGTGGVNLLRKQTCYSMPQFQPACGML